MPNLECPSCGTVSFLASFDKDSDAFCRVCDFPLFWARETADVAAGGDQSGEQRQRLPGVAGHRVLGGLACPVCRETNPYDGINCYRCGSPLHPEPEPVPPPPQPEPLPPALQPLLLKPGERPIGVGMTLTAIGLLLGLFTLGAGLWQAIDAAGPLFANPLTADAQRGLHLAIPAWAQTLGLVSLGLLLSGVVFMIYALVPHVKAESLTLDEAAPHLIEHMERMRP